MTEFEATPPRRALAPAAAGALVAVLACLAAPLALAFAGAGAAALLFGGQAGSRRLVSVGGAMLFAALVAGGATGLPVQFALVGGVGAVVAYDAAEHAVTLGHDVGSAARAGHAVLVHAASTTGAAVLVAAFAFGVYQYGPASLPVTGLLALLIAGVALAYALRD
ncbi:MAG: hypothetical protein ABEJ88_09930 [Halobacterium sp.]